MHTTQVTLNQVDYHVLLDGDQSNPPLVLLHGFSGTSQSWVPLLPILTQRYWVIAPDALGHGHSAAPSQPERYQMAHVIQDMLALLDQFGLAQAALGGYSMGGRMALSLAVAAPERWYALVLESASAGLANPHEAAARRASDQQLADRIEQAGIEAFVAEWEQLPLWASQQRLEPARLAQQRQQRLQQRPHGLANSLRGVGTGAQPALEQQLAQLQLPTLLIVGALDHKFVAINQQMQAHLPRAELQIIAHAGHCPHFEYPEPTAQIIVDWLAIH